MTTATVTLDGGELVIRLTVDATADELVTLADCGLEAAAVARLVASGKLRAVRIGRKLYVRRAALVALADTLPAVQPKGRPVKTSPRANVYDFSEAVKTNDR